MKHKTMMMAGLLALSLFANACDDDDENSTDAGLDNEGDTGTGTGVDSTESDTTNNETDSGVDSLDDAGPDAGTALSVAVTYNGASHDVSLDGLPTATIDGEEVILLSTIIEASGAGVTLASVTIDVEGSDGYRPSAGKCSDVLPTDGANAEKGGLEPDTRDLVWDATLGMSGCASVKDTAIIHVTDN